MVFFYLLTTSWILDIISLLFENSINQLINQSNIFSSCSSSSSNRSSSSSSSSSSNSNSSSSSSSSSNSSSSNSSSSIEFRGPMRDFDTHAPTHTDCYK